MAAGWELLPGASVGTASGVPCVLNGTVKAAFAGPLLDSTGEAAGATAMGVCLASHV